MNQVYIREARSEVVVLLDKHMPDRLTAIEEASKILQREVIRERANPTRNADWKPDDTL
jgi:hypothetical protein